MVNLTLTRHEQDEIALQGRILITRLETNKTKTNNVPNVSNILIFASVSFEFVSGEVLGVGAGVDQKIRNVNLAPSSDIPCHSLPHTRNNICCTQQQSVLSPRLHTRRSSQNQETFKTHTNSTSSDHMLRTPFFSENSPNFSY